MKIEVLGTGCGKCEALVANARTAVARLGVQAEIVKVTDIGQITERGVMLTPALVVEGQVLAAGRVPGVEEIEGWLAATSGAQAEAP